MSMEFNRKKLENDLISLLTKMIEDDETPFNEKAIEYTLAYLNSWNRFKS